MLETEGRGWKRKAEAEARNRGTRPAGLIYRGKLPTGNGKPGYIFFSRRRRRRRRIRRRKKRASARRQRGLRRARFVFVVQLKVLWERSMSNRLILRSSPLLSCLLHVYRPGDNPMPDLARRFETSAPRRPCTPYERLALEIQISR